MLPVRVDDRASAAQTAKPDASISYTKSYAVITSVISKCGAVICRVHVLLCRRTDGHAAARRVLRYLWRISVSITKRSELKEPQSA